MKLMILTSLLESLQKERRKDFKMETHIPESSNEHRQLSKREINRRKGKKNRKNRGRNR